jgi:hypothetical protein
MKNRFLLALMLLSAPSLLFAQTNENIMYSSGRIYVVIAVMLIILFGLILYLVRIDRKISKWEKREQKS